MLTIRPTRVHRIRRGRLLGAVAALLFLLAIGWAELHPGRATVCAVLGTVVVFIAIWQAPDASLDSLLVRDRW